MAVFYADIIIDIAHRAVDHVFQFRIPEPLMDEVVIGKKVKVPFGASNRLRTGYVVGISEIPNWDVDKIKEIHEVVPNQVLVEVSLIQLACWIKETYGSTMYQALQTVLPVKEQVKPKEKISIYLKLEEEEAREKLEEYQRKHHVAKERLLEALIQHGSIPQDLLYDKLNVGKATLQRLEQEGVIELARQQEYRNAITSRYLQEPEPCLNSQQQELIEEFKEDLKKGQSKVYLLHGVTGSGKTEVYIHAIDEVVKQGKQAIVLIPEIALTFQTVMRFRRHFGERITILNSRMSKGERYDQFLRIQRGEVDIVIGPRSALFAPFHQLGLIVVDEEHEGSYKSEHMPKYHAREVAIKRSEMENCQVILGSATPSVSSYYETQEGNYTLWTLKHRVSDRELAKVEIIDLRQELSMGNRSRFSYRLQELIRQRLEKKEQIIIFMNRRGYHNFVSCRSCGQVVECPHCKVSLTYHNSVSYKETLMCHYCGYTEGFVKKCKACGSTLIGKFGAGTQMVEDEIRQLFPQAKVLRMDADTTKGKNGHEEILAAFGGGEADILVGTQMIVKGHDFPNVTLVGILAADLSLHAQDYLAPERTFNLLTQAAGRAGRGDKQGTVVIQAYEPEHPVIQAAAAQDYECFYQREATFRQMMSYPPFVYMGAVVFSGKDETKTSVVANRYLQGMQSKVKDIVEVNGDVQQEMVYVGPTPCVVSKIKDMYRFVLYIKSKDQECLKKAIASIQTYKQEMEKQGVYMDYDLNPLNGY